MKELSASGLADLAGVAEAEVARLIELGVLVPRDGVGPFRETDVQKGRLAAACEPARRPRAGVARLSELGVLVPRDGVGPFRETDVQKVRLAAACEQAGLPMAGIAAAVQQGRLSFAFLEAAPHRRGGGCSD